MPEAMRDTGLFFRLADFFERRRGVAYIKVMIAVPRETDDPVGWSKDLMEDLMGEDHPYVYALHQAHASDGDSNVHIHLMFSPRKYDHVARSAMQFFRRSNSKNPHLGGAAKSRDWGRRRGYMRVREMVDRHIRQVIPDWEGPQRKRKSKSASARP